MNPVPKKHLVAAAKEVADAIASIDIDQEAREALAVDTFDRLGRTTLFASIRDTLQNPYARVAADPLVPCAGYDGEATHVPCPDGHVIRIGMHLSTDEEPFPKGRSKAWEQRAPYGKIRCVSCGARQFTPGYRTKDRP